MCIKLTNIEMDKNIYKKKMANIFAKQIREELIVFP
jgi:hypothetical protein